MTLREKEDQMVEEMTLIPDPYERLGYVVEQGKNADEVDPAYKIDAFKVEGCMSQLWVIPEFRDGLCHFYSDSDSAIVKGIATMLCGYYSGHAPEEILESDASFLGEVGITQHLSPNRRNGLSRIIETVHRFADSCRECQPN